MDEKFYDRQFKNADDLADIKNMKIKNGKAEDVEFSQELADADDKEAQARADAADNRQQ